MTKAENKAINLFIKNIVNENYRDANQNLQDIVSEKIKSRILKCEEKNKKAK